MCQSEQKERKTKNKEGCEKDGAENHRYRQEMNFKVLLLATLCIHQIYMTCLVRLWPEGVRFKYGLDGTMNHTATVDTTQKYQSET